MVCKLESLLERTQRQPVVQIGDLGRRFALATTDHKQVGQRRDFQLIGAEAGDRQADPVTVVGGLLDVVRRIVAPAHALQRVLDQDGHVVGADERSIERGKVVSSSHVHLLKREQVERAAPGPLGSLTWTRKGVQRARI